MKRKKDDEFDKNHDEEVDVMSFYDERDYLSERDLLNNFEEKKKESQIQHYFNGKNVLLTGASGFVGTLVLEKLIRTTNVNKIFILFRGKKSQNIEDRVKEYFRDDIFDTVKKQQKEFYKRVVIIPGELTADALGLSKEDENTLIEEVNVILHVAATVKFDEHLRLAYEINVKGTETIVKMAENMNNLDSFVYVSTAYSNCDLNYIKEEIHPSTYTSTELTQLINLCSDEELSLLNEVVIKPKPNTYVLTKSIAENIIQSKMNELPVAIVRPSIVMPTISDPLPCWVKGINGLVGLYIAVGLGIVRSIYQNKNNIIDMVPGDYVVNGILAVAWEIGTNKQIEKKNGVIYTHNSMSRNDVEFNMEINNNNETLSENIENNSIKTNEIHNRVFHIISGVENPITLGNSNEYATNHLRDSQEGSNVALWVPHHTPTNSKLLYYIYFYLIDLLPYFLLFKHVEKFSGKKPQLIKIYRKIFFLNRTVAIFSTKQWTFLNDNTRNMFNKLTDRDKTIFNFKMDSFDWSPYHMNLYRGCATYVIPNCTFNKKIYDSRTKYIYIIDNIFIMTMRTLLIYCLYSSTKMLLSSLY